MKNFMITIGGDEIGHYGSYGVVQRHIKAFTVEDAVKIEEEILKRKNDPSLKIVNIEEITPEKIRNIEQAIEDIEIVSRQLDGLEVVLKMTEAIMKGERRTASYEALQLRLFD